jgi:hypothetical protein
MRHTTHPLLIATLVLGLCAPLVGCGDDDDGGGSGVQNGIYSIARADSFEGSCQGEAASLLGTGVQEYFYVRTFTFFGQPIVNAVACPDPATCNEIANDDGDSMASHDWAYSTDSWSFSRTDFESELCTGNFSYASILQTDDGVTVEAFVHQVEDVPEDEDGFCDGDAAQAKVNDSNCTNRTIYEGTFSEALTITGEGTIYM